MLSALPHGCTLLPLSLLLSLSLLLLLCSPVSAADAVASSSLPISYFVLIDAGSTGSRAHVHRYQIDPARPLPMVEESENKKIKPGLSSYAKDPLAATQPIQDLLAFIRNTVPVEHHAKTPIHLHATAGLRSVTPQEAIAILDVVRDELFQSGFLFDRSWARVISGEQEGINGWMAVNYLLGVFDQPASASGPPPPSTGVVEMGGSSMQITFAPLAPTAEDRKQLNEVKVAGHSYWLYTHSFLQYGLQAAEKLYQKLAIQEIEDHGNPCYPPSYRHSSAGDFHRCTSLLSSVVDKSVACASLSCSFNGVYQPRIGAEEFLAIENFYYTAKFFGTEKQQDESEAGEQNSAEALPLGNQLISGLRRKGAEFCNQDWRDLVSTYSQTPESELKAFCFSAAYQTVLLESGLGFGPGTNLRVAKTIKGKGIDWEMGATIFELMPKETSQEEKKEQEERARQRTTPFPFPTEEYGLGATRVGPVSRLHAAGSADDRYCRSCLLYTLLFAVFVLVGYFGWRRYSKRGVAAIGLPSAFSQSAFNRV